MLKQRIITAAVLLPLVIAAILFLPNSWFAGVAAIPLLLIGGWEWTRLLSMTHVKSRALYVAAVLLLAVAAYFLNSFLFRVIIIAALAWWVIAVCLLVIYKRESMFYMRRPWIFSMAGFVVLVSAWWFLSKLHAFNPHWVLYLILLTVIADTAAYFSGKVFGKHKLAPELSPGKTIEGVMGAAVGVFVWSLLGAWYFHIPANLWVYFILLTLLTMVISIAGDLFISMMKRESGFKDSGTILPGHGGILDRIDSQLAALPIFTSGLVWGGLQGLL